MLPAIGQGALALEGRTDDQRIRALTLPLSDRQAELTVAAERALLAGLGGSCRTPLGGQAIITGDRMQVTGLVGRPDGSQMLRESVEGPATDAIALGSDLAARLRARGADKILAELG
jgi:hydroxymethylbilane synthase